MTFDKGKYRWPFKEFYQRELIPIFKEHGLPMCVDHYLKLLANF